MKRIVLFLATNVAVVLVLGIVTHVLGVDQWLAARRVNYPMLLAFSAVIGFAGSFISLALSKWMAKMAYSIRVIDRPQSDVEAWLVGKVREQTEKAGVGMPEVGIYESPEANAFATGASRNHALVAVSTGLLRNMRPREVEGVLAHEVSHVANGDMVTMTLLQGTLNTFVVFLSRVLGLAFDQFLRRDDDERQGPGLGYVLGSFVCQILLGILASLIVLAYSRHREFRADAMGAALEGHDAMIGGLRRLKQITEAGGVLDDRSAALTSFKINHPTGVFRLFMSHPPLDERIAALERSR
jgi:heat shock protein HtpX